MTLARNHIFIDGDIIKANHIASEFDQLYSFFTGLQIGKLALKSTFTASVLRLNNTAGLTSIALELRQANNVLVKFGMNGEIISLVEDIAPIVVVSTTMVGSLNAEFLDDLPITSFLLTGRKVDQYIPFYFDGIPVVGDKLTWIAPAGTTMLINQFFASSAIRNGLYPGVSDEASISLEFKKNGVIQLSLLLLQPLYSYLDATPISFSIAENDLLTVEVTDIQGTEPPRNIGCKMRFRQTLVTS